eukprot:UN28924
MENIDEGEENESESETHESALTDRSQKKPEQPVRRHRRGGTEEDIKEIKPLHDDEIEQIKEQNPDDIKFGQIRRTDTELWLNLMEEQKENKKKELRKAEKQRKKDEKKHESEMINKEKELEKEIGEKIQHVQEIKEEIDQKGGGIPGSIE